MQQSLFFEDMNDALREVIRALGGAKRVGPMLWPEKGIEAAQQLLLACLNSERRERLDPEQVLFLLREARKIDCHAAMHFIADATGYKADPIEPEDERAKLMRDYIEAVRSSKLIADRLERMSEQQLRAVK